MLLRRCGSGFRRVLELRLEGDYDADGWLCASPLDVQTERERAVLAGLGSTSTADWRFIERSSCRRNTASERLKYPSLRQFAEVGVFRHGLFVKPARMFELRRS